MITRTISCAFLLFFSVSTNASDKLHLKSGTIKPVSKSVASMSSSIQRTSYQIIQFSASPTQDDISAVDATGAQRFGYIPDNALLIKIRPEQIPALMAVKTLKSITPYLPQHRIDSDLKLINVFNQNQQQEVLIKLFSSVTVDEIQNEFNKLSINLEEKDLPYVRASVPLSFIPTLAAIEGVEYIQKWHAMVPTLMDLKEIPARLQATGDYTDVTGFETGVKVMNFESAWAQGLTGQGQTVAMADTGLDTGVEATLHTDFNAFYKGFAYGMFTDSWYDPMGHGTHVAGSVVSNGDASGGLFKGGASGAKFVAQGMWSDMINNMSIPPKFERFLTPAYQEGARIHTNSWGSPRGLGAYDVMSAQVDEFMWNHPDMLIIFAAGNSGVDEDKDGRIDPGSVSTPGTSKNALTVGASENLVQNGGIQRKVGELAGGQWNNEPLASDFISNNPDGLAVFSSRGPTKDGRTKPDVVAPGTNILSNCSQVPGANPLWGNYNKDYCYSGGTSMSTPLTAAAAAVIRQHLVNKGFSSPSAALVKGVIMHSAKDIFPGQFGKGGKSQGQEILSLRPNADEGFGRVDVAAAVNSDQSHFWDHSGLGSGEQAQYKLSLPATALARLTLVYTDKPGTAVAAKALVNNLDVKVTVGSSVYHGRDAANNFEYIEVPMNGNTDVTIEVFAQRVIDGTQPFALIVSH